MFHPLTYDVDLDSYTDPTERAAVEIQVNEYGQAPKQLFFTPHPKRFTSSISEIELNSSRIEELNKKNLNDSYSNINSIEMNSFISNKDKVVSQSSFSDKNSIHSNASAQYSNININTTNNTNNTNSTNNTNNNNSSLNSNNNNGSQLNSNIKSKP